MTFKRKRVKISRRFLIMFSDFSELGRKTNSKREGC